MAVELAAPVSTPGEQSHRQSRRKPRAAVLRSLRRRRQRRIVRGTAGWPLVVLIVGYPLWWAAGLAILGFLLAAVPMAWYLLQRRAILVPRGFGLWLLFLAWVLAGLATLWMEVPGAQTEDGLDRLLPFGYRLAWYLTATVFLLFIGNTTERDLPTTRVLRLFAVLFLVTVAGGYLGWLMPTLEFPSLLEIVLPDAVTSNSFARLLIHPASAQIQDILGYETPRPKAPFMFANDWGANYGLLLPFFVLAWTGPGAGWRRRAFPVVAAIAVPPMVLSLNRGLWLGIMVMAAYVAVRLALRGRTAALAGLVAVGVIVAGVLAFSPLGSLVAERIASPHSNVGRAELATRAVTTTADASPVIGFGSTRAVEGNFFSIAGGESPLCTGCSPPQLGTQGYVWFLVFVHGFAGAALFLAFVVHRFGRGLRDHSPEAVALTACVVFFGVVMFVYDLLSPPIAVTMVALGLLWRRERRDQATQRDRHDQTGARQ